MVEDCRKYILGWGSFMTQHSLSALAALQLLTPVLLALPASAQDFINSRCSITGISFAFEKNQTHRTVQTFSGQGCTASFGGGLNASFDSIAVVKRAQHLTITPTSNGFGFTVARRTPGYKGPDSYTLKICGAGRGGRGCVTITYDVTVN
jgi:hypothetical protein